MNAFEKYGMTHLSPSSINLFAAEPALWALERIKGMRFPVGCAAHRGSASEMGVQAGLMEHAKPIDECQDIALKEYDRLTALSSDPRRQKEREAIPGIVANAIKELRQYGPVTGYQGKIVTRYDGVPVDVLGFYDFEFGNSGVVVDLKTSLRLPSEISTPHARQVAHYVSGRNMEARVCYSCPGKLAVYRLEDPEKHIGFMVNVMRRMERFLSLSDEPDELISFLVPRVDEFWWSEPTARAAALKVYGI